MLVVKRDREIGSYLEGLLFSSVVIDFSLMWGHSKAWFYAHGNDPIEERLMIPDREQSKRKESPRVD